MSYYEKPGFADYNGNLWSDPVMRDKVNEAIAAKMTAATDSNG